MATRNDARGSLAPATPLPEVPANPLVEVGNPYETLINASAVLAFVRDWNRRKSPNDGPTDEEEYGLALVLAVVDEAVQAAGADLRPGGAA